MPLVENETIADSPEIDNSVDQVAEFYNYVAQNAHYWIESSRMPGVWMRVGTMMNMCPEPVTSENVGDFRSELAGYMVNAQLEKPEPQEESEEEEAQEAKVGGNKESKQTQEDKKELKRETNKQESQKPEKPAKATGIIEEIARSEGDIQPSSKKTAPEKSVPAAAGKPKAPPAVGAAGQAVPGEPEKKAPEIALTAKTGAVKTAKVSGVRAAMESGFAAGGKLTTPEAPKPPAGTYTGIVNTIHTGEESDRSAMAPEVQVNEPAMAPSQDVVLTFVRQEEESEATIQPEPDAVGVTETELPVIRTVFPDEVFAGTTPLPNAVENTVAYEITGMATDDLLDVEYAQNPIPLYPRETAPVVGSPESIAQSPEADFPVPIEIIETVIEEVAGRMETLEADEEEAVHQLLDKVMELPAKLEITDEGEFVDEAMAREELEELFTELFKRVGMEYTPELLDSLVKLSLHHLIKEDGEAIVQDTIIDNAPRGKGTHEFITKPLAGITNIKKILPNVYMVGKSALQLYMLDWYASRSDCLKLNKKPDFSESN